jgi:tRNA modification GTPase
VAETIYALASARGRSGVAVIRISGPAARSSAAALGAVNLEERRATLVRLSDPRTGETIDHALAVRFAAPRSFTGEDTVELHLHGGVAVVSMAETILDALPDMRMAQPGEFTRRALMNGKLDLAQVEGLGDLIAAETAGQAKRAFTLMDGRLGQQSEVWRHELMHCLAHLEATIDFADEDLPDNVLDGIAARLSEVELELAKELAGFNISERIRLGFDVAIVGRPNVGKSTLLNRIAGRDAALTSEIAGTTRDVIEVRLDLNGLAITLIDMAGIREARDHVETLGVGRALKRGDAADLRIFLVEDADDVLTLGVAKRDEDLVVRCKGDRAGESSIAAVSGLTGRGVDELLGAIAKVLQNRSTGAGLISHERQRFSIERAHSAVQFARRRLLSGERETELAAEDLRSALEAFDVLVGKVDVEAILDIVFRNFCLGK